MPYIYYLLYFWKDIASVETVIVLNNEVNAMILVYVPKLSLKIYLINVRA